MLINGVAAVYARLTPKRESNKQFRRKAHSPLVASDKFLKSETATAVVYCIISR